MWILIIEFLEEGVQPHQIIPLSILHKYGGTKLRQKRG